MLLFRSNYVFLQCMHEAGGVYPLTTVCVQNINIQTETLLTDPAWGGGGGGRQGEGRAGGGADLLNIF